MEVIITSEVIIGNRKLKNLITNKGLALFIQLMTGGISQWALPQYVPQTIAIGTGTTEAKETDTSLESEYARASYTNINYSGSCVTFESTFEFDEDVEITEAGLVASDNLYSRVVFSPIKCEEGGKLEVRWLLCLRRK